MRLPPLAVCALIVPFVIGCSADSTSVKSDSSRSNSAESAIADEDAAVEVLGDWDEMLEQAEKEEAEEFEVSEIELMEEIEETIVADDVDAAAVAIELKDFGEATAPKNDLLPAAGGVPGTGLSGRESAKSKQASGGSPGIRKFERNAARGEASDLKAMRPGHLGRGPGLGGDKFDHIVENDFKGVTSNPLSTFSIDVDTASYAKTRQFLLDHHNLPPAGAVRIEELVNYFVYDYEAPADDAEHPFAAHMEVAECPWTPGHRIVRIGLKGKEMGRNERPASNLVFLLDVSGSMNNHNKLPLLKQGMKMLVDQLGENDTVSIVVYASATGLVLPPTNGDDKPSIINALDQLHAGGSTNGGAGIHLAYNTALENFINGGVNRVILCTDGDFNVGTTSTDDLITLAEDYAKKDIFLSVMGFGSGNLNDSMMEQLSGKANGNYSFIDTENEARKVLVEQMSGTLVTIAKDVKIQVEFNPAQVQAYRLIGYENRILAAEDFNDDKKDAGEIGAGHTVTALYEIVPTGVELDVDVPKVDALKYQANPDNENAEPSEELLTLKLRYKQPTEDTSTLMTFPLTDNGQRFGEASGDFKFASSVAAFGMILRGSQYKGEASYAAVLEIAGQAAEDDATGYRKEFLEMVKQASQIAGE